MSARHQARLLPLRLQPKPVPSDRSSAEQILRPIGDRLLLRFDESKEQIVGGILLPESAREKPQIAEVLALGRGPKSKDGKVHPFAVKRGDRVLVAPYAGAEIKFDGRSFTFVREDDILGVLA